MSDVYLDKRCQVFTVLSLSLSLEGVITYENHERVNQRIVKSHICTNDIITTVRIRGRRRYHEFDIRPIVRLVTVFRGYEANAF